MIDITEPKIAGLAPRWAPFPGFSLLFDPPGDSLRLERGVEILACDVEGHPHLGFYRGVFEGFEALRPDRLLSAYGLCALPPPSYHVTAFDVANVADLKRCRASVRDELQATLDRLPDPAAFEGALLARAREFARREWDLAFRYGELKVWNTVVALLEPVDPAAYAGFVEARAELSRAGRAEYGIGAGERFTPHLSLGYFMNDTGAELARSRQAEWDAVLRESLGEETVVFRTASLYGFTDMATFFRRAAIR